MMNGAEQVSPSRDLQVSDQLYWAIVKEKLSNGYSSVDEALRPKFGLPPGPRPFLKGFPREQGKHGIRNRR